MMVNTLKLEDKFEGEKKSYTWKVRVLLLLEGNDLKEYVEEVVPSPNDLIDLEFDKKREVKDK
jgi:hypothetical protein